MLWIIAFVPICTMRLVLDYSVAAEPPVLLK